jgi:hypothetical protein
MTMGRAVTQELGVFGPPCENRGEGSRSEAGGYLALQSTPLLPLYVRLPPYFIGGTNRRSGDGRGDAA